MTGCPPISLASIPDLSDAQVAVLQELGLRFADDLPHYRPVHDAILIKAIADREIPHDFSIVPLVVAAHAGKTARDILALDPEALVSVRPGDAARLRAGFAVATVGDLAQFAPFVAANKMLALRVGGFSEPASAPQELLPAMAGAIASSAIYSSFTREKTLRLDGLELVYDDEREGYIDERIAALFPVRGIGPIFGGAARGRLLGRAPAPTPEITLGLVARLRQDWVNHGTFLGEVQHSLALAPGESRNIAIVEWSRSQVTRRTEDTGTSELLGNSLVHSRALDEVARSVAAEHQFGGTIAAAGTLAQSSATVLGAAVTGGIAGSIPGAAIGALVGAIPAVASAGVTIPAGALAGAVVGFGVGAAVSAGFAAVSAANAQLGVVRTDSTGIRGIAADVAQDITETTLQKSSSIRSLWSNIYVSDTQAENNRLQSRNVTNYNHMHAMTVQYYEVLQHYRATIRVTAAEPLLFLPFRPLDFTTDLISDFWDILRQGIADSDLRARFDRALGRNGLGGLAVASASQDLRELSVSVLGLALPTAAFEAKLTGSVALPPQRGIISTTFSFAAGEVQASAVAALQLRDLLAAGAVRVSVRATLQDGEGVQTVVTKQANADVTQRTAVVDLDLVGSQATAGEDRLALDELERHFRGRRYHFTRLLLLSMEPELLSDLVDGLMFRRAFAFPDDFGAGFASAFAPRRRDRLATAAQAIGQLRLETLEALGGGALAGATGKASKLDVAFTSLSRKLEIAGGKVSAKPAVVAATRDAIAKSLQDSKILEPDAIADRLGQKLTDLLDRINKDPLLDAEAVALTRFVQPEPLAITGNSLVFRMKDPDARLASELLVKNTPLTEAAAQSAHVAAGLADLQANFRGAGQSIYLPTSGVFAEAILGRSNASEKLDVTRFFNWQDSSIPHLAPAIAQLVAESRAQAPLSTEPTVPPSVLNIVNPAAFPDPTGLRDILGAIQNGAIFRDNSKSEQLTAILGNLSQLAAKTAEIAGGLAGDAQTAALKAASDIAATVADLARTPTQQGLTKNDPTPVPVPPKPTPVPPPPTPKEPEPKPAEPAAPKTRQVRVVFRVFVPAEAWEFTGALVPDLSDPTDLTDFLTTLAPVLLPGVSVTRATDLFFALTRMSGQNRTFSRTAGTSMAEVEAAFDIDLATMTIKGLTETIPRKFAPVDFYRVDQTTDAGGGKPEWFETIDSGATPIPKLSGKALKVADENFALSVERAGESPVLRLKLNATPYVPLDSSQLPLADATISIGPVSFSIAQAMDLLVKAGTRAIEADIKLTFTKAPNDEIEVRVSGVHDAFPFFEVYVNEAEAYRFPESGDASEITPENLNLATGKAATIEKSAMALKRIGGT